MTNTYPLVLPMAFCINEAVAAQIIKSVLDEDVIEQFPEDVRNAIKSDEFPAIAADASHPMNARLRLYDMLSISDVVDILQGDNHDDNMIYCSEFQGSATQLDTNARAVGEEVDFDDDYIIVIEPAKDPSFFHAPYQSIDDFIAELKAQFVDNGYLPADFDFMPHIVRVSGTYCC